MLAFFVLLAQAPARRAIDSDAPLLKAIERKDERAANRAIDAGASPNAYIVDHETLLMKAAATGSIGMVRLLVRRGADVRGGSRGDWNVLDAARWGDVKNPLPMVRALLALGARPGPDTLWGYVGYPSSMRVLLAARASISVTALNEAIERPANDCLRLMLSAKAPVNGSGRGGHPLHTAAKEGNAEAVRLLLEYGANRDLRDDSGLTAAQVALATGHDDVATLLGAKPSPRAHLVGPDLLKVAKPFATGFASMHDYAWCAGGGMVLWRPVVTSRYVDETRSVVSLFSSKGRCTATRLAAYPLSDASLSPDGTRMVWSDAGKVHVASVGGTLSKPASATEYLHILWTADARQWVALGWNTGPGQYDRVFWQDGRDEPLASNTKVRPLGDEIDPTWVADGDHVRTVAFVRSAKGDQDRTRGTIVATSLTPTAQPVTLGTFVAPRGGTIEEATFSRDGERIAWIVTLPRDHRVGVWTSLPDGTEVRCVGTMLDRSPFSYGVIRDVWLNWRMTEQPHHLRWTREGGLSFVVKDALYLLSNPAAVR